MSYLSGHINSGLKVGDKVKVFKISKSDENGWDNTWVKEMNEYVNRSGIIIYDNRSHGFKLYFNDGYQTHFEFPYFVLSNRKEKIKKILNG